MSATTPGPVRAAAPPDANGAPERRPAIRATGVLLRFVSCGLLSLTSGLLWRQAMAPPQIGAGSALAGVGVLLLGFVLGGALWYVRDVSVRRRAPQRIDDERIVFSFVVFVLVPFAVLLLTGAIWLLAMVIGAR